MMQTQRVGVRARLRAVLVGIAAFLAVIVPAMLVSGPLGLSDGAFPRIAGIVATSVGMAAALAVLGRAQRTGTPA